MRPYGDLMTGYPQWAGFAIGTATTLIFLRNAFVLKADGRNIDDWTPVRGKLDELQAEKLYHVGYTAMNLQARYSYEFGDSAYRGRRISALDRKPILFAGPYEAEVTHLRHAFDNGSPVTIFVNPGNPSEAVLLRIAVQPLIVKSWVMTVFGVSAFALSFYPVFQTWSLVLGVTVGLAVSAWVLNPKRDLQ